jgi:hypothetical protein
MKILFVAMAESVHVARWIGQIADLGWDIHVFPSCADSVHPELNNITYHAPPGSRSARRRRDVRFPRAGIIPKVALRRARRWFPEKFAESDRLARLISALKPDVIHSLEIQHAGYLTLAARNIVGDHFPTWIVTNYGSDSYLFGRIPKHREKIQAVLAACDDYDCESQRDVAAARSLGFRGEVFTVHPNAGGYRLGELRALRSPGPTSGRRTILLKGYQGWAGRALVGLRALALCADVLKDYRIAVYNTNQDVEFAAELLAHDYGLKIDIVPKCSHQDMLRWHGSARASIGLSIGDGVSTSFLEALVMGSFPIQSCTASADEWIGHGESGMIVPPEDPQEIAAAIRRAVTDDELVDRAAAINAQTALQRLEYADIRQDVIEAYRKVYARKYGTTRQAAA